MNTDNPNQQNRSEIESNHNLNDYVSMAQKTTNGLELIEIIKQVLESPSIYVFGELLDLPNVQQLNSEQNYQNYLKLLNIFAYGTYQDYKKEKSSTPNLPDLTDGMLTKLRQLSIVSLAKCRRHIPYQELMMELEMDSIRNLENLIIETIYANIFKGYMDQQNNRLEIDQTIARDVREEDLNIIGNFLSEWCGQCESILTNLEQQMISANQSKEEAAKQKQSFEAKVSRMKQNLKSTTTTTGIGNNDQDQDYSLQDLQYNLYNSGEKKRPPYNKNYKNSYRNSLQNKAWKRDN